MEQNLKMVLLHVVSLKLGDISSSLWSSLFTWVTRQAVAACPRHAASCVCHLAPPPLSRPVIPQRVSDNGRRAGKWTSGAPVPRSATSALFCSVQVQIWCVMIWQSGVAELGIAETRPPARRPTGRPYGRWHSALNSSSSPLTLLLACSSFFNESLLRVQIPPSPSVICHIVLFPSSGGASEGRVGERHGNLCRRWVFNYSLGKGGCCITKWAKKKSIL